jgi:hypothetical protein
MGITVEATLPKTHCLQCIFITGHFLPRVNSAITTVRFLATNCTNYTNLSYHFRYHLNNLGGGGGGGGGGAPPPPPPPPPTV